MPPACYICRPMQAIKATLPLLAILLAFSCEPKDPPPPPPPPVLPISEALLGTWETIEIEAQAPTYQGQDTAVHHLIREADWGRLYGVRPSRTVYTPDGKLRRTYYTSAGQVTDVTHGIWKAKGSDSLFVIEPNTTLNYKYVLENNLLTLTGTIDWDYDGEKDDAYRAVLRLVSRTTE